MVRLAALLAVATSAALAAAAPVPKSIKKPAASLDGTWEVVEWHANGNRINSPTVTRWVINGNTLNIERINKGGGVAVRPATVNYALTKPDGAAGNALDYTITYTNAAIPPRTMPGVFELDGDTLKFCMTSNPGADRPAECKAGQGTTFYVFKRLDAK